MDYKEGKCFIDVDLPSLEGGFCHEDRDGIRGGCVLWFGGYTSMLCGVFIASQITLCI